MTKDRDTAAESIADVLALLSTRRQDGLLSVEHWQAGRFEEGEIFFQVGQPVYVKCGQMFGLEALNAMLSWRQITYSFTMSEPFTPVYPPFANASETIATPEHATHLRGQSQQVRNSRSDRTAESAVTSVSASITGNIDMLGLESLIPQKVRTGQDVLSLPLTRPQRFIYLLVDGHRSISDLARCTRKSLQEIEQLLTELQASGLITVE